MANKKAKTEIGDSLKGFGTASSKKSVAGALDKAGEYSKPGSKLKKFGRK